MRRTEGSTSPTRDEIAAIVRKRVSDVAAAAQQLISDELPHTTFAPERIHALRVASRKALVALSMAREQCEPRPWRRLRRYVRDLRRAAGVVRDCDVHAALLRSVQGRAGESAPAAIAEALSLIDHDRRLAGHALHDLLLARGPRTLRRAARRVRESVRFSSPASGRITHTSTAGARVQEAAAADLSNPAALHELRLACKSLRYAREVQSAARGEARAALDGSILAQAQIRLGEVNDVATLVSRLIAYVTAINSQHASEILPASRRLRDGLAMLAERFSAVLDARCASAAAWWKEAIALRPADQPLDDFLAAHPHPALPVTEAINMPLTLAHPVPATPNTNGAAPAPIAAEALATTPPPAPLSAPVVDQPLAATPADPAPQANLWIAGLTIGVIDVGSNSIRLLVVEMIDERSWRILGEERAMTRLAHGLAADNRLSTDAMARSVEAIARFKTTAERLGAPTVRAFATAAVRDAANGQDFVALVRDRTGMTLEVISAQEEGAFTHRSVSRVHDLSTGRAAVVDIGGGSMEVVYSDAGVITANASMPLGALRVTEQFGGAEASTGHRFREMRRFIRRTIQRNVRRPEDAPDVLVGCGGTFTTILTLVAAARGVMIERNSPALASLGPISRVQVRDLIRLLRALPLEQRLRVPGLPADRADIVIAGLSAVVILMKHLGCDQLRVHPGGVREGLVMHIVEEHLARRLREQAGDAPDARIIDDARALARRCRYEASHCEHVATLALSLYDQLLASRVPLRHLGEEPHERALLAAAAVLHDVGIMVDYKRHHRHGETIIRHMGLPSCSPRQTEVLAMLARFHRKRPPTLRYPAFAALPPRDQALVWRLAAILRTADGLDRSHTQHVHDLCVAAEADELRITITAQGDPEPDIRAARKKGKILGKLTGLTLKISPPSPIP
ncbi:MAG: CHAD domain-containing protein [Planctomycetes bacterium]|nr:CHAD domain-containing protein [Planctomycetota bacterium]